MNMVGTVIVAELEILPTPVAGSMPVHGPRTMRTKRIAIAVTSIGMSSVTKRTKATAIMAKTTIISAVTDPLSLRPYGPTLPTH